MIVIEPKVKFTKAEVECIRNFKNICNIFDFDPWDVIYAIDRKYNLLHDVAFEYEGEEKDED